MSKQTSRPHGGKENIMHFWYSQTQRDRLKAFTSGPIAVIINNMEHEFTTCSDDLTACPAHLDTEYIGYAHVEDIRFPEHNNEDARL